MEENRRLLQIHNTKITVAHGLAIPVLGIVRETSQPCVPGVILCNSQNYDIGTAEMAQWLTTLVLFTREPTKLFMQGSP